MSERKCKGCGNFGDFITFHDEATEYCNMCEYDNIPTIDGLRAEVERLREANEKLMVELELQVKKYIWATCGVPKPQAVQEQE